MIIKVDHITEVVKDSDVSVKIQKMQNEGYKQKFAEYKLKNISSKKKYMRQDLQLHDMYFWEREKNIPIEMIAYEKVGEGYSYALRQNQIDICVCHPESVGQVLLCLGTREIEKNKTYNIRGVFDKQDIIINLIATEKICTRYLDDEGLGCITLLIDSIQKIEKILDERGVNHTDVYSIEVAGKQLYVMFVNSVDNEVIIELISNRR